ncbi:serine protease Do [Chitinivorax tropicus]|uniref:Probable periplasmic serine endoprotease DegP-like n=1 Tax=Chitinivorax tropicus TaxID=714531 RepID=A0A840MSN4_9PROT|nr:DegQ family serine endoprotease [Chitinivorax tropicus]MBB5020425.1 serine protease Do [Chitinivorax tropicus]
MKKLPLRRVCVLVLAATLLAGCNKPPSDTTQKDTKHSDSPLPSIQRNPGVTLPDFTSLIEKEGPAVVNISTTQTVSTRGRGPGLSEDDPFYEFFKRFAPPQTPRQYQTQSLGSGFVISDDGYILTNAHVVAEADEVNVRLTDKREFKAKVIGVDRRTDVALVKINATGLPKVPLGDPDNLRVGEWVVAIGQPFGFDNSVTAGIVSAKGRSLPDESYVPFIQTDVPINPGNSGGPLFNMKGEVVGINSQIYSRSGGYMGISFAIPIDVALNVAKQLQESGKVSRGKIGVQIQPLTQELAQSFGLKSTDGALVSMVEADGPAAKAGLQPGDVIVAFNNQPVKSSNELPLLVANIKPGSKADLKVWRKGREVVVKVTVAEMPTEKMVANADTPQTAPAKIARLGLQLSDLSAEQRNELRIRAGVLIEDVEGPAAKAGLETNDVILAVNSNEVASVAQFTKLISRFDGGTIALLVLREGNTLYVPLKLR